MAQCGAGAGACMAAVAGSGRAWMRCWSQSRRQHAACVGALILCALAGVLCERAGVIDSGWRARCCSRLHTPPSRDSGSLPLPGCGAGGRRAAVDAARMPASVTAATGRARIGITMTAAGLTVCWASLVCPGRADAAAAGSGDGRLLRRPRAWVPGGLVAGLDSPSSATTRGLSRWAGLGVCAALPHPLRPALRARRTRPWVDAAGVSVLACLPALALTAASGRRRHLLAQNPSFIPH